MVPYTDPSRTSLDNQSVFWSVRSRRSSTRSIFGEYSIMSDSTGFHSQHGETWPDELTLTRNSGFVPGAPRNKGYKHVREGREKGGFLPQLKAVGRIGKAPARISLAMVEAAKQKSQPCHAEGDQLKSGRSHESFSSTVFDTMNSPRRERVPRREAARGHEWKGDDGEDESTRRRNSILEDLQMSERGEQMLLTAIAEKEREKRLESEGKQMVNGRLRLGQRFMRSS